MAICPEPGLTGMIDITPSRCATKRIGGVNKRMFVGSLSDLAGFTLDPTTKEITGITMKSTKRLFAITGKKLKNSHSTDLAVSENATLYNQSVTFLPYFDTQEEKEAIEVLVQAEDLFIVVENNYGRFEAFGLVGVEGLQAQGLAASAATYAVEAAMDGASNMTITFSGSEAKLPVYTKLGEDLPAELAVLEGLLVPAA